MSRVISFNEELENMKKNQTELRNMITEVKKHSRRSQQ